MAVVFVATAFLSPLMSSTVEAATPVSSGIALESFARLCSDDGIANCDVVIAQQTDTDQDSQAATLDPLLASVNAVAFDSGLMAGGRAQLSINANFSSVASGTMGFSGFTGIGQPQQTIGLASCTATNNLSDGFSYTFVASTSGEIEIDYDFDCAPEEFVTASGSLEMYFDGSFFANPSVSASNQIATGTVTRPIVAGQTHTLRIKPNLAGVGGSGCGPPPGWSWSCSGSASWTIDVAPTVPSPAASSRASLLLLIGALVASGGFALRRGLRDG